MQIEYRKYPYQASVGGFNLTNLRILSLSVFSSIPFVIKRFNSLLEPRKFFFFFYRARKIPYLPDNFIEA